MSRRPVLAALVALTLGLFVASAARSQCILANPSFELPGSSGQQFGGWNQFGPVGSTANAPHGHVAARVTGPNTGIWDVAGYWQQQTTTQGRRWAASVRGWHSAAKPLTGGAKAILNIEWRNSGGGLISYESHTVADASTPVAVIQDFYVESAPAPVGAVATRIVLGVLQGPGDATPDVFYDQARFEDLGPPTLADAQWGDFPGGRSVAFGGRNWRIKGPGFYGPGPNLFSDGTGNLWVDLDDRMHLTVKQVGGQWYSTEAVLEEVLGYGDYVFTTIGDLGTLHPSVVFGLFIWQYGPCYDNAYLWWNPYNEIDVEFSRWGNPASDIAQFVAQPWDYPGNIHRFAATFSANERTSHAFRWLPDRVEYRSWRGGPNDEAPGTLIHSWTYTGPHIPRPEIPRVHVNLWRAAGTPTTTQEVVLEAFTFKQPCFAPPCIVGVPDEPAGDALAADGARAWPNPFGGATTIRYVMPATGECELAIYDVAGRHVRSLSSGIVAAGEQQARWDGRDDAGNRVASGVYLYRLRTAEGTQSRRVIYLR